VTKAIHDFNLIEDGDRVMVGLSGGKDSWALFQILDVLRRRAPIKFSLVAVNVDSGYEDFQHGTIKTTCDARGCGAACFTGWPTKSAPPRSPSAIMPTISSRRCC
jgi:tRNA(Ile)-lysidine synthase TilS/MesJ